MTTLRHEHLVRIIDPANAIGQWLTRDQLWEGLRHTVLAPCESLTILPLSSR
jgi:hypothetical protein